MTSSYFKKPTKTYLNDDLFNQRIVVWDTETTGRYHQNGDRMIQFSGVEIMNGEITQYYEAKFNPVYFDEHGRKQIREVEEEAYQVHKISNEDLKNSPTFAEKQQEIVEFMKGAICIAHNEKFDIGFLNSEFKHANSNHTFKNVVSGHYDSYLLSRSFDANQAFHGLDALVKRYSRSDFSSVLKIPEWHNNSHIKDVDLSVRTNENKESRRHDALIDCALLAKVMIYVLKEKWDLNLLKDFKKVIEPKVFQPFNSAEYQPVLAQNTEQELADNQNYLNVITPKPKANKAGFKP